MKAFISNIDVSHDMIDVGRTGHRIAGHRSVTVTLHLINPSSEDLEELRTRMSALAADPTVEVSFPDPEPPKPAVSTVSESHSVLGSW